MKTWIIAFVILIAVSVGLMFSVFKMFDSGDTQQTTSSSKQESSNANEFKEQTKKIGGITYDLKLSQTPDEHEVINVMHHMTHQKVKADD
ncbi:hypothetical protein NXY55_24065, partial [Aeromonas veronii]|nr:hypothetical protein [Aeromonas veronii]